MYYIFYSQALGSVSAACAGEEDVEGGYNSEDEYSHIGVQLTEEEWQEKDRRFERLIKKKKGKFDELIGLFNHLALYQLFECKDLWII